MRYKALRIHGDARGHRVTLDQLTLDDPAVGEVLVRVTHSSVNYKDALAGTGRGKILRAFPLTGGIDAAGYVARSRDGRYKEGDAVIATGWGLGVDHDGGYAQHLRVPAQWLVPCPPELDPRSAMILGTAGFTAALAVWRMQLNGQYPELGPIVVTGASGGVGSISLDILTRLGYEVTAVSAKADVQAWLRTLGAKRIIGRDELPGDKHPLGKATWGGAIDNVGGEMLARLTRTIRPWGNIACVGLAGDQSLHTTVMPFILRGVSLLGCNSVDVPFGLRLDLWTRLAKDWRPPHLEQIRTATKALETLPAVFERMMRGQLHGRVLVEIAPQDGTADG